MWYPNTGPPLKFLGRPGVQSQFGKYLTVREQREFTLHVPFNMSAGGFALELRTVSQPDDGGTSVSR
jgi:hypothetical protein